MHLENECGYVLSSLQDLNKLAALVRGNLSKLGRATLCALITISVNARDIVTEMVLRKVRITFPSQTCVFSIQFLNKN